MAEVINLFDNWTLDDIKGHHDDNMRMIYKACEEKMFPSLVYARSYRGHLVTAALERLGMNLNGIMMIAGSQGVAEDRIDEVLNEKGIKIENWHKDMDVEPWKLGVYIYKNSEIAYFISIIRKSGGQFFVKTNFKFD